MTKNKVRFGLFRIDDEGNPVLDLPPLPIDENGKLEIRLDKHLKFLGKTLMLDLGTKHGYRVSPGVNPRAKRIGELAKGKSLAERKSIFAGRY